MDPRTLTFASGPRTHHLTLLDAAARMAAASRLPVSPAVVSAVTHDGLGQLHGPNGGGACLAVSHVSQARMVEKLAGCEGGAAMLLRSIVGSDPRALLTAAPGAVWLCDPLSAHVRHENGKSYACMDDVHEAFRSFVEACVELGVPPGGLFIDPYPYRTVVTGVDDAVESGRGGGRINVAGLAGELGKLIART